MKKIVVFILGFISGAVALLLVSLIIAGSVSDPTRIPGLTLFEQAGEVMESSSYQVMQVVDGGNALAYASSGHGLYMGMLVLFLADEDTNYYDDQIIKVPQGKCVRQVGTYRYEAKRGYKTVPVVSIYNK